ncbi:MAG TPA: phosphotransferase [Candidatus Fimivivens sp.]|nr:phosphotransferase [Candidatus Fimivivens sp.]
MDIEEIHSAVEWAKSLTGDGVSVSKEKYGDQSSVLRLNLLTDTFFLKIGKGLAMERDRLEWLEKKVSVPRVIGYTEIDGHEALLLSAIEGKNLAELKKEWSAEKVVDALVIALKRFHSVNVKDFPFGVAGAGKVLVHGDACLPNFLFAEDGRFGYVDVGGTAVDDVEADFSAAIWSLHYNLGPGYGAMFLKRYGIGNVADEYVETLRLRYEDKQD